MRVPNASPGVATASATSERSSARPLLTVIVPVFNGGDEIVGNLDLIRGTIAKGLGGEEVELIVVSDGSLDDTAERLLAARSDVGIRVIHYDRNLGKGYAVKTGALASHGQWVALVDADLDVDPADVPMYVAIAREEGLDFAIGSKRHPQSIVHYPRSRRLASRCYQAINRLLFRLEVRDTQVGLKVFSRGVVDDIVPLLLVKRFAFDLELLAVATALGHGRVRELPVRLEYRFSGSQLRSRAVVRALVDTAAIFYRLRILRTYQRKRRLLRRAAALLPEAQPLVSLMTDSHVVERLDYPRLKVTNDPDARSDLIALLAPRARPAGNWIAATVPFFADAEVAAVVAPALTPLDATLSERAAGAVLESRLGGASRRSRFFPGNVAIVSDHPAETVVLRREDYVSSREAGVDESELVAWLAQRSRRTIYTPDTSISAPPPPLALPHLRATYRHARRRGLAARRSRGSSLSTATMLSLVPLVCAVVGGVLVVVVGGTGRDIGLALIAIYAGALVFSAGLAALRFRSLPVGLITVPALVATQATYIAGFVRGLSKRP